MKIDGKEIAARILKDLRSKVENLKKTQGVTPKLGIVFLGNNRDSEIYVKRKGIAAEQVGIEFELHRPQNSTPETVEELVTSLSQNPSIHGLIVQRPIPKEYSTEKLTQLVGLEKDVDGFLPGSRFTPPIAGAVLKILEEISLASPKKFVDWLHTKRVVLIGRGETAGIPIAKTFTKMGIKFELVHSKTENKESVLKQADVIISSVGKPHVLTKENLKQGVILIGVGLYEEGGKLKGDYVEEEITQIASYYTPTPGGTGPVNVACLMENVVNAAV